MKEKIANSIAEHQEIINELKSIKARLQDSVPGSIRFVIKSQQLLFTEFYTHRDTVPLSFNTVDLLLDEAIKKEKDRINKLIDMEIERHIHEGDNNGKK